MLTPKALAQRCNHLGCNEMHDLENNFDEKTLLP
jgi:hypothetical protein